MMHCIWWRGFLGAAASITSVIPKSGNRKSGCRSTHSPPDAAQQAQRAPAVLLGKPASPEPDAHLDRVDQRVRPLDPIKHQLVEAAEPGHLQQLRARHVE